MLLEEEFVQSQEVLKPRDEKNQEERTKVDDIRGSPMSVGSLEEIIDDNHAIVSSSVGPEYYVNILSFVDKDELEPGCAVLLHNKVSMPAPTHAPFLPPASAPPPDPVLDPPAPAHAPLIPLIFALRFRSCRWSVCCKTRSTRWCRS